MNYKQRFKDMPIDKAWTNESERELFIQRVSDLAFGLDAIERGYSMEAVLEQLEEFSDNALKWEEREE
tara:strand:+ start:183 stop:386 length:204 start_codon:yes stop_codon:yes gene_type:complete